MSQPLRLSVVMPAYNEGAHIYENCKITSACLSVLGDDYEIVCVNDGSKDNTGEEIARAAAEDPHIRRISYEPNGGKGHAIRTGVMAAEGERIAFLDSDLDLAPDHILAFMERMDKGDCQVVIGSKMHPDSKLHYPFLRKVMSFGYYVILRVLFRLRVHDTQTGVKLFEAEALKAVIDEVKTKGFAYDIEILALLNQDGKKIAEMPIRLEFTRESGFGRIRIKDIVKVFTDTLAIKKRLRQRAGR